jgi:hypothetical protein
VSTSRLPSACPTAASPTHARLLTIIADKQCTYPGGCTKTPDMPTFLSGIKPLLRPYPHAKFVCPEHACRLRDCLSPRERGSPWCQNHGCRVSGCSRQQLSDCKYCESHSCDVFGCTEVAVNDGRLHKLCSMHSCATPSCREAAEEHKIYCLAHDPTCRVSGCSRHRLADCNYCDGHCCDVFFCTEAAFNHGHVHKLCKEHTCVVADCREAAEEDRQFCEVHRCGVAACTLPAKVPGGYCSAAGHGCSEPGCCRAAFATAMCSEHIMFRFAQHTSAERAEAASRRAQQEIAASRPNVDSAAHQAREKSLRKNQEAAASRPINEAAIRKAREKADALKAQEAAASRPNVEAAKAREKADALRAQDAAFSARAKDAAISRRNEEEAAMLKAQVESAASKAAAARRFEELQTQRAQEESDLRVTETLFLRQVMAQMSLEEADAKKAKQEAIHLASKEAERSARAEALAKDKAARAREESRTSNMAKEPTRTCHSKKVEWDFSSSRSSNTKGFGGPPSQPCFAPIPQEGRREINLLQELDLQRLSLRQSQENEHEEMRLFLWNTNPRQRDDILRDLDAKHEEAADAFEKDARAQLRALRDEKEYRPFERSSYRNNYW